MNGDPSYVRVTSLHLSRTLDEIGLNTRTVKRIRDLSLQSEQALSTYSRISGKGYFYNFGSQSEGATTPGLHSDYDLLTLFGRHNVIEDWAGWERGNKNLLIIQENTAPGYCRLQVLSSDIPIPTRLAVEKYMTHDSRGRVILKNSWVHNILVSGEQYVRNGPALSHYDRNGRVTDTDSVRAFRCASWPEQAKPFIRRQRRYGWPTQRLIQEAIKHGVFLVPVGYKLSLTEHLEWRISASLAERCLMFSLSIVHIKCYVVLKMLMKTFVEPRVGKSISSYHCKTALLYSTENTESGFWREDNLLQCVTQCLLRLLFWVIVAFCPHFIIPEENLFAGKVTADNRSALQVVLTDLIKRCDCKILKIQIDDLGVKLQRKLNTNPSKIPVLDSLATKKLLGVFDCRSRSDTYDFVGNFIKIHLQNSKPSITALFVNHTIRLRKYHMRHSNNKYERRAAQSFIEFLYRWLGSILASISLSRNTRVPRRAIQLLHKYEKVNVTSMLKIASVFYCNGDARKVEAILHRLEQYYGRHSIQPVCKCYDKGVSLSVPFELYVLKSRSKRSARFAHCVTFSQQEIHCAPPAVRSELFRSFGDDMQYRHIIQDQWMVLAVVDCHPYLYFLQYITYRQLGQRDLQTRALHNLFRCIIEGDRITHMETAWNLLGQCFELEQQPDAAMTCYRTSLGIRSRNNAANWHVAILCYRLIRDGYLPRV